ncbi:hypothetical protein [Streptomyces rubiginosohelvolus]|uniref:hypothetical protein n=1 Tax=Streptomyces rubiginosohelvolus TaxID=67362 RepID=UPI003693E8B6
MSKSDNHGHKQVPQAEGMREFAAEFVGWIKQHRRLPLDYSPASLRVVDFLIQGMRKGGRRRPEVDALLTGFGAYVGEVLVRKHGATWCDFNAAQREYFGQPVGVLMPDGRVWSPLSRVVNRFEIGKEESLQRFYLTMPGRSSARCEPEFRPGLVQVPVDDAELS